jgi:putative nucleotidyltransferase with HDIG domain
MELTKEQREIITYVQSLFDKPVYLVGGACRNILLDKPIKDYDFCSEMTSDEIKEAIKGKHKAYCIGEKFGTIGFRCLNQDIEITTFREEEYATKSRKPNVTFGTDLLTDLSRRDFTINSLALNARTFELIDPFNGQKDIEDGIVRAVGSPKLRFNEDPLRILRCIRFATVLGFEIEELTLKKLKQMNYTLMRISKERWVEEFNKILQSFKVFDGLKLLWETRVFNFTIPELALQWGYDQNSRYHNLELWEHTANVVKSAQEAGEPIEMLWAALFHDIGKPATRTDKDVPEDKWKSYGRKHKSNYIMHEKVGAEIASRLCAYLKFSNKMTIAIYELIRNHLKDESPLRVYDNMHKSALAGELDNGK